jgi:hypothetical protein
LLTVPTELNSTPAFTKLHSPQRIHYRNKETIILYWLEHLPAAAAGLRARH